VADDKDRLRLAKLVDSSRDTGGVFDGTPGFRRRGRYAKTRQVHEKTRIVAHTGFEVVVITAPSVEPD
jgi:hypothetical protein